MNPFAERKSSPGVPLPSGHSAEPVRWAPAAGHAAASTAAAGLLALWAMGDLFGSNGQTVRQAAAAALLLVLLGWGAWTEARQAESAASSAPGLRSMAWPMASVLVAAGTIGLIGRTLGEALAVGGVMAMAWLRFPMRPRRLASLAAGLLAAIWFVLVGPAHPDPSPTTAPTLEANDPETAHRDQPGSAALLAWWGPVDTGANSDQDTDPNASLQGQTWPLEAMAENGIAPVWMVLLAWLLALHALALCLARRNGGWPARLALALVVMHWATGVFHLFQLAGALPWPVSPGPAPWVDHAAWWVVGMAGLMLAAWVVACVPGTSREPTPPEPAPGRRPPTPWSLALGGLLLATATAHLAGMAKMAQDLAAVDRLASPLAEVTVPEAKQDCGDEGQRAMVPPTNIEDFPKLELGEALLHLMPDKGERFGDWGHRANGPIQWLDCPVRRVAGEADQPATFERLGVLRVHVLGTPATVLKAREEELWWAVLYSTTGMEKFGVQEILLQAGLNTPGCFGTYFSGCSFDVLSSLHSAGITATPLCDEASLPPHTMVYRLQHPARSRALLTVESSHGSGGSTTWMTMRPDQPRSEACSG